MILLLLGSARRQAVIGTIELSPAPAGLFFALAEIERLRSEAADLQHTKFDRGLSNLSPMLTASATDWFKKFLERKQALTG